ncbi:MAG TPA: hypothetical protein DCY25_10090, partial [Bacteroidales bacterium]|nr:hypothetical protein [Bacteroidales bacterium]
MYRLLITSILLAICNYISSQSLLVNVIDYGAVNDGKTINTKEIQKAIDDCAKKGGGTVHFPAGRYVTGTIFLKNFITINLESGAV